MTEATARERWARRPRLLIAAVACLIVLAAAAAVGVYLGERTAPVELSGFAPGSSLGGPFELTQSSGAPFGSAELSGTPALMYFGYSFCPDVCPTELVRMSTAVDGLAEAGITVRPVFISVDPERDTAGAIAAYVPLFHPDLVGLGGTADEIATVAGVFGVFYEKAGDVDTDHYLMDHTSFIYLLAPDGDLVRMFTVEDSVDGIVATVAALAGGWER